MWCYAIGVEAVGPAELVCSLVHCLSVNIQLVKWFASSWYVFLTYIYDARSHLHQILEEISGIAKSS